MASSSTGRPAGGPVTPPREVHDATQADRLNEAGQRAKKRNKRMSEFDPTARTIEIILRSEDDEQLATYCIHENLLRDNSGYLEERIRALTEREALLITNVDKRIFGIFLRWIYTKKLAIVKSVPDEIDEAHEDEKSTVLDSGSESINERAETGVTRPGRATNDAPNDSDVSYTSTPKRRGERDDPRLDDFERALLRKGAHDDKVYTHLIDAFHFAVVFDAAPFKHAVMLQTQFFTRQMLQDETRCLPSFISMRYAVEKTGADSLLSQYLASCYGSYTRKSRQEKEKLHLMQLSPVFLVNAFLQGDKDPRSMKNFCQWHDHGAAEDRSRKACKSMHEDSFEKRAIAPDQPCLVPLRHWMCPGVSLSPKHRYYLTAAKRVVHVDLSPSTKGEHGESSDSYTSDSEPSVGEQSDKESDDSD